MPTQYIRYFAPVAFALSIFACAYRTSLAQDPNQVEKNGKPAPISTAAEAIEVLKSDAGTWEAAVTLWPRPDSVPITSHAVVNAKLDVGGKLLEQRCSGKFGPANENRDWTCLSYTNFDVSAGQFETVRMASSGSPIIIVRGKGKYDKKLGMSIELTGQYSLMGNQILIDQHVPRPKK